MNNLQQVEDPIQIIKAGNPPTENFPRIKERVQKHSFCFP